MSALREYEVDCAAKVYFTAHIRCFTATLLTGYEVARAAEVYFTAHIRCFTATLIHIRTPGFPRERV